MSNETTPLLRNHAKEKLAKGEPVYSMTVRLVRSVESPPSPTPRVSTPSTSTWSTATFPLDAAGQICLACNHLGVTPLVRVPGLDPAFIGRVMDSGAMGSSCPECSPPTRHSPRFVPSSTRRSGERSLAGAAPQLHYRALPRRPDRP